MGVTSTSRSGDADRHEPQDAPTRELVVPTAGIGDRCASCGAPLASDQRYCVNCGERRGGARFSVAAMAAPVASETSVAAPAVPRPSRVSAGMTLILGVGALLLAMLVGVLIGHNNSTSRQAAAVAPPAQVVTINGGGAGGAASTGSGGAAGQTAGTPGKPKATKKRVATKKVVITKKVAAKATAAASNVLGGATNLAPPTVQQGGACSSGQAGCQNGQFTGNFFGGG